MKNYIFSIIILITPIFGNIIYVPTESPNIQAGIDSAADGDTVLVMAGTYVENINFEGKNILVSSLFIINNDSSFIELTTIDGDEITSVVIFNSNEDSSSILNGFTIRGGLGYLADPDGDGDSYSYGGGVYCEFSSPTLSNLIIKENASPDGGGGGIFCYDADPIITNSTVIQNSSNSVGGGLYCKAGSNPIFNNVIFDGNWASHGGGAYLRDNSIGEFYHCVFQNNSTNGSGGGITLKNDADIILDHVFFIDNLSDYYGGGLYCNNASPALNNVTITLNESDYGGGIYCRNGAEPSLLNTIIWDNIGSEIYFRGNEDENNMTIAYSNIEGGTDGVTTNDNADVDWLEGNIALDPLFCWPSENDYYLVENSPCAISGQDSTYMGAYGIGCPPLHMGPDWHVAIDSGDDYNDGSFETPFATITRALQQAEDGDSIIIHPGEYFETIDFTGKQIVVGSLYLTSGDSIYIEQTVIKGAGPGSIIVFESGETNTSILKGLTLSDGTSSHGGAIYIAESSPLLEDIIINSNTADYGGGIYFENAEPILQNIVLSGNSANYGGALFFKDCSLNVNNITIEDNMAYYGAGIYLQESIMEFEYTLIVNNESFSEGGAIYCFGSNILLNHLTIADNVSFNGGGALLAFNNSNLQIQNSILWNNSPQEIMFSPWETFNYVSIMNSDVMSGIEGVLTNDNGDVEWDSASIALYPLFCDPDSGNFQLALNSPCLDAGGDSLYMGAYGMGCEAILSNQEEIIPYELSLLYSYPNPFNPSINIPFTLPAASNVEILIVDILGRVITELSNKTWSAGRNSITWDADHFSSGVYFIHFTAGDYQKTQRIVLLK